MNCKNKPFMTKRKAFTLIELLIVIAIIGILFIVLVSKVDFATDKAKATGVQTDFRSFQMAFDTVAKENAGFNTFGWDTGDANQNGKRDSYDEGDNGAGGGIAKNGIQDGDEVFTGHKVYDETFTKVFSLKKNGTGNYDREALNRLETAINANLDPKLHITIKDDGEIVMANGAQDPWNKEYHGWYITNAEVDGKDRGAIVLYSDGANNEFGSEHIIANGIVTISIPGSNKAGKDDYSIVSVYTYVNGYGEVKNITSGFNNNQTIVGGNGTIDNNGEKPSLPDIDNPEQDDNIDDVIAVDAGLYKTGTNYTELIYSWDYLLSEKIIEVHSGRVSVSISNPDYSREILDGDLVFPNDSSIKEFNGDGFSNCKKLRNVVLGNGFVNLAHGFRLCTSLETVVVSETVTTIGSWAFNSCQSLTKVVIKGDVLTIGSNAFGDCKSLKEINIPNSVQTIQTYAFEYCSSLETIILPDSLSGLGMGAFRGCSSLKEIIIPENTTYLNETFRDCTNLQTVVLKGDTQIQEMAFMDCKQLSSINLGNINTIGESAFKNCKALTTINFPDALTSIGNNAFKWSAISGNIVLPEGLETIGNSAFYYCPNLTGVQFPSTLKTIGNEAFDTCETITELTLPYGLENIGQKAFRNCIGIKSIVIPDSVTTVGNAAFNYCYNVETAILSSSMTMISESMFEDCWRLKNISIPDSITIIGARAFARINAMKEISLPSSIETIQTNAFHSCYNIETIYFDGDETQWNNIIKETDWDYYLGINANNHTYTVHYN